MIKLLLFLLCCDPNLMFCPRVTNDHKMPGLQVGSAGSASRHEQTFFDDLAWYRAIREMPHGSTPLHLLTEENGALFHLFNGIFKVGSKWLEICSRNNYSSGKMHLVSIAYSKPNFFVWFCLLLSSVKS